MSVAENKAHRPVSLQGDLRNLPDALAPLKALPNWVCWRWQWTINKKGVGRWTKPPFRPSAPDQKAKNNDPATWGTYEEALAAYEAGECDGIGFNLLATAYAAFDLDDCRDPETGEIAPEAMAIVNRATSYTEITASGTGLRVIGLTESKKELHRKQKIANSAVEVESYRNCARYIVITGNPLPSTWPHIAGIDAVLDVVVAELDLAKSNVVEIKPSAKADAAAAPKKRLTASLLPFELMTLIEDGVGSTEDRSAAFHHAVCWLCEWGRSAEQIECMIAGKPIVPERYYQRSGGLAREIARCLDKAKNKAEIKQASQSATEHPSVAAQPLELFWHGIDYQRAQRKWLVKDLIPETGTGLASGQWGAAKTFAMIDLSASIMTATPFAGRPVCRRGGVVFVAAEGASEIPTRLQAVIDHKLRNVEGVDIDLERMPFAWLEQCPSLQDDLDFLQLVAAVKAAGSQMQEHFKLPLALIIIDTLSAAAAFKDGNDAAEGQMVMNRLGELSRASGAVVMAVDHFGKVVETGTRGTSAKEASADVVLALLAERDVSGTVSKTRMAVRKLRAGATGAETKFGLKTVSVGIAETTCVVEWDASAGAANAPAAAHKERWPNSLRTFRGALETMLIDHGRDLEPFGTEPGPKVRAVAVNAVRNEFLARWPAENADAKARAFTRALRAAVESGLIASREISGIDHVWFVSHKDGTSA